MTTNKNIIQKIILGGVIIKNNKILILQRHKDEDIYPNLWELPSGRRELLESSIDGLKREIKEETNLDIEIIMPFSIFDYQIEKPDEIRDSTQINFLVKSKSDSVTLSEEHQSYAWISQKEIEKYNITTATKKVIDEAFKLLSKIS